MMIRITLAGVAAIVWALPAPAQGTFEGMVTYNFTSRNGRVGVMRYYELGGRTRQEFESQGHTGASIIDPTTGNMTILMPAQKKYMVINMKAGGPMAQMMKGMAGGGGPGGGKGNAPDLSRLKVTATGQHEVIAGIPCDDYHFTSTGASENQSVDICGAKGMGFLGAEGAMIPSTETLMSSGQPELAALAHDGFFPLKVKVSNGGDVSTMEATAVSQAKPDASLFAPPSDYTQFSMPGMPGGTP
jgi:hypothetical protein